jgi:hypothetical protein
MEMTCPESRLTPKKNYPDKCPFLSHMVVSILAYFPYFQKNKIREYANKKDYETTLLCPQTLIRNSSVNTFLRQRIFGQ